MAGKKTFVVDKGSSRRRFQAEKLEIFASTAGIVYQLKDGEGAGAIVAMFHSQHIAGVWEESAEMKEAK